MLKPIKLIYLFGLALNLSINTAYCECNPHALSAKASNQALVLPAMVKQQQQALPPPLLVDIRNPNEFRLVNIPGSLNIPTRTLKTKHYLKSKPLILVAKGFNINRLKTTAKDLKQSGFMQITILQGGLNLWQRHGLPLAGQLTAKKALKFITPEDYIQTQNNNPFFLIDISQEGLHHPQFKQTIHIPYRQDKDNFFKKFSAVIKLTDLSKPVLIIAKTGQHYESIQKRLKSLALVNLFYLAGGLENFQQFSQNHVAMVKAYDKLGSIMNEAGQCR